MPKTEALIKAGKRNDLGKILKQRRVIIPLRLKELARAVSISPSYLGRIEKGQRFPSAWILGKIAKPLGYSEGELFALAGYLPPQPSVEREAQLERLDPYVARVLSGEPLEVQRTVIAILSIFKSMGQRERL